VLRSEGPTAVGHLNAGARLAEAFGIVPEAAMVVLLPVLAAYDRGARDAQQRVTVRAVRYLVLAALPVVIVVSVMAPTLLAVLYGAAYVAGTPALRVLAWLAVLAASGAAITNLLIARGRERFVLLLNAFGSVLTLGLSLALVARAGFIGAAVATLTASVACHVVLLLVPTTREAVRACFKPLVVPLLAALALAVGASAVLPPSPVAAGGALALFALILVATGSVGREDWTLVRRLAGARDPG
jgi:O-antigen/teichoic acid export membrane protein